MSTITVFLIVLGVTALVAGAALLWAVWRLVR